MRHRYTLCREPQQLHYEACGCPRGFPVWRLILHVLSPFRHGRISRATKCYAYPANGLGKNSQGLLEALQAATCRRDLHLLTLCPLQGIIAQPMVLEAWRRGVQPALKNGAHPVAQYTTRCFGRFVWLRCARPPLPFS